MTENELSYEIRGCLFSVYNNLGPGLLESAYEAAVAHELNKRDINFNTQVGLPIMYELFRRDIGYRLDVLVENKINVEIKTVETLLPVPHKRCLLI